ncbi:aspartic peptidase domain-containing protein [Aspergillus similis]
MGDGVNSGLLGLGYPSLTSAHPSNVTDNTTYWFNRLPYKPILYEMYDQGLIREPYFAHVLARSALNESGPVFGGYLSLGELPPVAHSDSWAIAPVEIMNNIPLNFTSNRRTRSYWATTLSATLGSNTAATNSASVTAPFQAFFDSGNPLSYIPSQIADPLNNLFSPPGVYNKTLQAYVVDCDAKAPSSFSLEIDGQTFTHDAADLIYQTGEDVCISAIGNSDEIRLLDNLQLNVIGVPFLKSVVAVFDIGKNEMRFAKLLKQVASESGVGNGTGNSSGVDEGYVPGNVGQRLIPGLLGAAWCLSALACAFIL